MTASEHLGTGPPPGASAAVARRFVPRRVQRGSERLIEADQTNLSIVVDEEVVVKWLRPPVPAPHPGVRAMAHLAANGFVDMPAFHGHVDVDGSVTAIVTEYVAGSVDGWEWYVAEFLAVVDGTGSVATVRTSAIQLGELAARLHVALATPSDVMPSPIGSMTVGSEAERGRRLLDEALTATSGSAGERLRSRAQRIAAAVAELPAHRDTTTQPVHGDLHVGQVLRSSTRMVLTDFDGNPMLEPEARHRPRPAVADVASLVQSIDHVGRVAARRRGDVEAGLVDPAVTETVETLIGQAIDDCLAAYRNALAFERMGHLFDDALLWPLRVVQELHELVYAARYLPRWTYAPDGALASMFP